MLILKQEITEFISTNLSQPRPEWSNTVTYNYMDEVTYNNHVYRSMIDGNTGINPGINSGKWLLYEVDNSFAAIDMHALTASEIDDGLDYIEYVFDADGFTHVALSGVYAASVDIFEYEGGTELASRSKAGISGDLMPIDVMFDNFNPATDKIMIRAHKYTDGNAYVETMVGGEAYDIGEVEFGLEGGFIDYSTRETDSNGITTIKKRNVKEIMNGNVLIDSDKVQEVKRHMKKKFIGETLMFIADPSTDSQYENLLMPGYITDFSINLSGPEKSYGSIEIEESL